MDFKYAEQVAEIAAAMADVELVEALNVTESIALTKDIKTDVYKVFNILGGEL